MIMGAPEERGPEEHEREFRRVPQLVEEKAAEDHDGPELDQRLAASFT